jgi:hypothetical protein
VGCQMRFLLTCAGSIRHRQQHPDLQVPLNWLKAILCRNASGNTQCDYFPFALSPPRRYHLHSHSFTNNESRTGGVVQVVERLHSKLALVQNSVPLNKLINKISKPCSPSTSPCPHSESGNPRSTRCFR